jgi:hypothetical protein
MTGARTWNQSVRDTSYPYELIGAQFQTLFMLLRDEIRHNQRRPDLNQARSHRLTLAQGELMCLLDLLRVRLSLAQPLHEGA